MTTLTWTSMCCTNDMRLCMVFRHIEHFSRCVQLIRARIVVTESILLRTKVLGMQQISHGRMVRSSMKCIWFLFGSDECDCEWNVYVYKEKSKVYFYFVRLHRIESSESVFCYRSTMIEDRRAIFNVWKCSKEYNRIRFVFASEWQRENVDKGKSDISCVYALYSNE